MLATESTQQTLPNEAEIAFWRRACTDPRGGAPRPVLQLGLTAGHVAHELARGGHPMLVIDDHQPTLRVYRGLGARILNHPLPRPWEFERLYRHIRRRLRAKDAPTLTVLDQAPWETDLAPFAAQLRRRGLPIAFSVLIAPGVTFLERRLGEAITAADLHARLFEAARRHATPSARLLVRTNNPLATPTDRKDVPRFVESWPSAAGAMSEQTTHYPIEGNEICGGLTHISSNHRSAVRERAMLWAGEDFPHVAAFHGWKLLRRTDGTGAALCLASACCVWEFTLRLTRA